MKISTKGRYALRVMIALARKIDKHFIKLQDLSEEEQIPEKYLEGILGALVRGHLVEGARGKLGGYRLNCKPEDCSVWQILTLVETSVSPVACLDKNAQKCARESICVTLPIWRELDSIIRNYLQSVKLEQFLRNKPEDRGKIPNGKFWNCGL